jgi:hypothetical protein
MNTAQPALLYLVPCLLLSTIGTGLYRHELTELFTGQRIQLFLDSPDQQTTTLLLNSDDNTHGQHSSDDVLSDVTIRHVNQTNNVDHQ